MTPQCAHSNLIQSLSDVQDLLDLTPQSLLSYPIEIRCWKRESGEACEIDYDLEAIPDALSAHEKMALEKVAHTLSSALEKVRCCLIDFVAALYAHPLARRQNYAVGTSLEIAKKEITQIYLGWTLYQDPDKAGGAFYSEPFELAKSIHPQRLDTLDDLAQTFCTNTPLWVVTGKKPFEPDISDYTKTHLNVLFRTYAPNAEIALRAYAAMQATWLFKKGADLSDIEVFMASPLVKDFSL